MIKHFILIAWRNIRRRKTLSAIQILCLSVGLAAFILVARYVQYEKDYDKFNENFDRIYRVQSYKMNDRMNDGAQVVVPLAKYIRENVPEAENAIATNEAWDEYLSPDEDRVFKEQKGIIAPSVIFDFFSFKLIRGNKTNVLDDPNSIVLSESMAERYFPGEDAMGKIILDEKKRELRVTGIMEDILEQSSISATYFRSNANLIKNRADNWTNSSYEIYVLLKPNASAQLVSEKIEGVLREYDKESKQVLYLHPLSKLHLNEYAQDDKGSLIFFFSFLGILTLLLACVSFMNLTTSFSTMRAVEIGIRKVSGSNRNILRVQFLTEAVLIALISLAFGVFLAYLLLPLFNTVVNRNIDLQLLQNPLFVLFLLATVVVTGFIGGSYPALFISRLKPVNVLKGRGSFNRGKVRGLTAMVYLQFILSVVLLTSSIWMYKQVTFLKNKDLGYTKDNLLYCQLPSVKTTVSYRQIRERILDNPGIENMSLSINSPLHSSWGTRVHYEGGPTDDHAYARWNEADENYLNTMSMTLAEGRNFSTDYSAETKTCLINETAAKQFSWDEPIGRWLEMNGGRYTVIGVLKDFNCDDVHNPIIPYVLLYRNEGFASNNDLTFKVNPNTMTSSLEHINAVLNEAFPNILFEVNGYDVGTYRIALKIWTSAKNTFAFFTIMAVLIAAMGLFGLVVFASQRRVKEIGIRKVQGAQAAQILPLITRQFIILVVAANIIVYPLANFLKNVTPGHFKYQFTVFDLLLVLGISVVVTLLSSGYQALKASLLNPVEALRYE
ncbi:ABC transporter permease [Draconibacterium sp. IB214405]|uniref:ABC transporter permease n=1 Tax=Draconibacterium sp. IB214405 TaxID=3097352 RepID=UPI002A112C88|nr:ABC transporter permease [Draconibacterium sp. IB214405]MDX8337725.1 ABC transporter permease [Draconibacterium sp. IB214405]